ncbi:MAG TPA: DegV family protein [Candidatus Humimicrobiaceae bacterium]|nr:DegV family protein [Candidatus Humimicrobiaceae bacterium]
MKKIGLVVDEAADLPKEIIEKYQIEVAPLKMDWPDLENFPGENTFQKMREAEKAGIKSFGKTSQPSPKDFLEIFKKQFTKFEKIITITITSVHSGTYNSACQAKNFLEPGEKAKIFIIDSLSGSAGLGLLVLKAVDLVEGGKEIEEITKELESFRPKICLAAMVKDPKWIESSGRIPHFLADWIRKMEKIGLRPILGIKNGKIKAVGIRKGARDIPSALFQELKEKTEKLRKQGKKIRVAITHGDNLEGAQRLEEAVEKELSGAEVTFLNLIDNILGVLTGPDSLIVAWCES